MGPLPASPGCDCQICRPEPAYDELDRATLDGVLEHGWQVMLVSDDAGCSDPGHDHTSSDAQECDASGPDFAYTVGLGHRADHPELLMSGLDTRLMHHALDEIAGRVLAGRRFAPGDVLEGVLGGVPVVLEEVSEAGLHEAVTWSGWFHRRQPKALMVVWPGSSSILFAWQPGAPDVLDQLQPPEWREPIVHRGAVGVDPRWNLPVPPDQMALTCTHVADEGWPVLWVARQRDEVRGEDWSIHCGGAGHADHEIRVLHIAHLVRAAPSLRQLGGLELDHEAIREHVDAPWVTTPIH